MAWILSALLVCTSNLESRLLTHSPIENVAKGSGDRPSEDVVIVDCGELEIELEVDENGKQVPIHAEL